LDDPARGFSLKHEGPLDMRMNPNRGASAATLLEKIRPGPLATLLAENADEPNSSRLSEALAGRLFQTTISLARAIRAALPKASDDDRELAVRRVFQALRIAVNDEFGALEALLRNLPRRLKPGGRVAILTFHSGEDRRVKKSFQALLRDGVYSAVAQDVIRASPEERRSNPRSSSAKLRWARKSGNGL
jgi:16S rRNA (cytosine1402-N4)-methyltransferase